MSKWGDSPDYEWRRQLWECRRHGAVGFRGRLICEIGWHHERFRPGIVRTMSGTFFTYFQRAVLPFTDSRQEAVDKNEEEMIMRKMKTIMSLAAAVALAGILLTGCSTEADEKTAVTAAPTEAAATEAASGTGTEAEKTEGGALAGKKISVMTPYLTSVTTNQMAGYIKEDLEAEGAEVFVIDTANDFAELASRIEDVVSSGTDGIVLVSADPNQVANQLQDAFDADIPVFGCDSGFIDGMQINATSDNYQMGELIVRYLFDDLMDGKGTVIALTHRPHPGVVKRCEAFDDIIKEYPDIKLITEQHVPAEQPINDAQDIVANLLTANPEKDSITAVFAAWDEPAIGAAKALQEAGRDEVIVTGVDGNEQAVEMIKDGTNLKATVKQNFEGMADIVCEQMDKYFDGEEIEKGEMYAPAELITQENAQ